MKWTSRQARIRTIINLRKENSKFINLAEWTAERSRSHSNSLKASDIQVRPLSWLTMRRQHLFPTTNMPKWCTFSGPEWRIIYQKRELVHKRCFYSADRDHHASRLERSRGDGQDGDWCPEREVLLSLTFRPQAHQADHYVKELSLKDKSDVYYIILHFKGGHCVLKDSDRSCILVQLTPSTLVKGGEFHRCHRSGDLRMSNRVQADQSLRPPSTITFEKRQNLWKLRVGNCLCSKRAHCVGVWPDIAVKVQKHAEVKQGRRPPWHKSWTLRVHSTAGRPSGHRFPPTCTQQPCHTYCAQSLICQRIHKSIFSRKSLQSEKRKPEWEYHQEKQKVEMKTTYQTRTKTLPAWKTVFLSGMSEVWRRVLQGISVLCKPPTNAFTSCRILRCTSDKLNKDSVVRAPHYQFTQRYICGCFVDKMAKSLPQQGPMLTDCHRLNYTWHDDNSSKYYFR